jgi:hypothetical protein
MLEPPEGTRAQSLLFDRRLYSASDARSWASAHGFRTLKTEDLADVIRIRQEPSGRFVRGSFRAVSLDDGVQAIIALPKQEGTSRRRSSRRKTTKRKKKFDWKDPLGWVIDRLQ